MGSQWPDLIFTRMFPKWPASLHNLKKTDISFCKYVPLYIIISVIYVIWGVHDSFNIFAASAAIYMNNLAASAAPST